MLLSVLTRKGQIPGTTPPLGSRPRPEEGLLSRQIILLGFRRTSTQHPVWVLHGHGPGWGQVLAGSSLQRQVPDPTQPSSLKEPERPGPSPGLQAFHLNWRDALVANTNWVNPQFPKKSPSLRGPNHRDKPEVMMCKILAYQPNL